MAAWSVFVLLYSQFSFRRYIPGGIKVCPNLKAALWNIWLIPGCVSGLYPEYRGGSSFKKTGMYSYKMIFCNLQETRKMINRVRHMCKQHKDHTRIIMGYGSRARINSSTSIKLVDHVARCTITHEWYSITFDRMTIYVTCGKVVSMVHHNRGNSMILVSAFKELSIDKIHIKYCFTLFRGSRVFLHSSHD